MISLNPQLHAYSLYIILYCCYSDCSNCCCHLIICYCDNLVSHYSHHHRAASSSNSHLADMTNTGKRKDARGNTSAFLTMTGNANLLLAENKATHCRNAALPQAAGRQTGRQAGIQSYRQTDRHTAGRQTRTDDVLRHPLLSLPCMCTQQRNTSTSTNRVKRKNTE